jgi:hypothetical protein
MAACFNVAKSYVAFEVDNLDPSKVFRDSKAVFEMLSRKTWKYNILTIKSGCFFKIYSQNMRAKGDYYEVYESKSALTKPIALYFLMWNICLCFIYAMVVVWFSNNVGTTIFISGMVVTNVLMVGFQLWHLYFGEEINSLERVFVEFNNTLRKTHSTRIILADV